MQVPQTSPREPFRALLVPHRSLSRQGFLLLMAGISLVSFVAGIAFLIAGAWPVLGFFGLDVLIVYVAFKLNYRSGRLHERVEVDPVATTVTRVHPSGKCEAFSFATAWVRVRLIEGVDGRTELRLTHHDRQLVFGRFLNDDERRDFANALTATLVDARGGPLIWAGRQPHPLAAQGN